MAKKDQTPENDQAQNQQPPAPEANAPAAAALVAENPNAVKKYELWPVSVERKKRQNPETFEVETYVEFKKKGTEPLSVTHIEPRHAEILNQQSENSKTRYYLAETKAEPKAAETK